MFNKEYAEPLRLEKKVFPFQKEIQSEKIYKAIKTQKNHYKFIHSDRFVFHAFSTQLKNWLCTDPTEN